MQDFADSGSEMHRSKKHCGFVINRGNASAAEVMELMRQVEDKVEENSGVRLEAEVRRIGEF